MGMYTKFEFEGTVKPQYRPIIKSLYDTDLDFKEAVHNLKMVPFYDLAESERGDMMFYGAQWQEETKFDESSGFWHLECEIKDYPEQNPDGTYKPKNSSKLFIELLPELCETDKYLAYSSFYEEDEMALRFEYIKGKWIQTNKAEYDKAWNEAHGMW